MNNKKAAANTVKIELISASRTGVRVKLVFNTTKPVSYTHLELGYDTMAPFSGTVYDLADNVCLYEAKGVKIQKASASPKATRAARAFEKLLALGYRLITVIRKNEGTPNKDLERFSRDVQSLCDKWDRTDM